jgi:hypothetical protein
LLSKEFIKFKIKGGSTQDFFNSYSKSSEIGLGDIKDEDYQDALIRRQLQKEGWDKEDIEDRLEYLTESNKKSKFAERYHQKLAQEIEEDKQALLEQTELQKQRVKEQEDNFKGSIKKTLDESEDFKGIKISPEEKNTILNFLTKKDQKIDNNKSITGFQKTLSEAFNDPNKVVLIAKLLRDDFDFSTIEKSAVTKKTKQVRKNIEQRQSMRPYGSGSSSTGKDLASLFEK